jgi:hypothetical protein
MSAPLRCKAKKQFITFTLVIEVQEMIVTYQPNWMTDVGHFEFRSPLEPPRRIPISETGYRSHFASMADVEAASSPQDYAWDVALELLRWRGKPATKQGDQLPLF